MRPLPSSSSACRSRRPSGDDRDPARGHRRSVAMRRPSCSSAISPRIAPGPTSVTDLHVDLHPQHAIEQQEQLVA